MPNTETGKTNAAKMVAKADPIIDVASGLVFSKLSPLIDQYIVSKVEQSAIVEGAKQKFSSYFSRVLAQKLQAFASPSMSQSDSFVSHLRHNKKTYGGGDYIDQSKHAYDSATSGKGYQIKRSIADKLRANKKTPIKFIKIPFSLIPGGTIAVKYTFKGIEAASKGLGDARKKRKRAKYDSSNLAALQGSLGASEGQRKVAKWHAKDIAELGPKLQRNLAKLKQAAVLLDSRQVILERLVESDFSENGLASNAGLKELHIRRARDNVAMSYHEVKHYIDKVQAMSVVLQTTAVEVTAHVTCFDAYLDETRELVEWSIDH
ncbi:hypothetical protein PE36_20120 [Moritella sp. PE36]|uniref:hypothetical protein n=1 Tax=Moritella sp. PE36 TaxID=58051 RepID=UPI0001568761|nr:hypothetical protein [Moritella sp. PE36]EDM68947.1 hypothetical protein PE36_20120 [Moritella sp. PE36]